jgi:hypothetical protein
MDSVRCNKLSENSLLQLSESYRLTCVDLGKVLSALFLFLSKIAWNCLKARGRDCFGEKTSKSIFITRTAGNAPKIVNKLGMSESETLKHLLLFYAREINLVTEQIHS